MSEKIKILIVDDNENECKTLKNILDRAGYQIFIANGSKEAVNLVRETEFGLILMDLLFKGDRDGVEIFKDIKVIRPDAKVILLTGYGPEEERGLVHKAWEEGMIDEFLRKPIEPGELINVIEKHAGGKTDAGKD